LVFLNLAKSSWGIIAVFWVELGMKYEKFVLGELQTNTYLLWDEKSREGAVIDPADEADFLAQKIQDLDLKLKYILLTHGHFDHCLAALDLKLMFGVDVYVNKKDQFLLDRLAETASWWLGRKIVTPPIKDTLNLNKRTKLKLGKEKIEVIETPGHSPGGVSFYVPGSKLLFSGDTIFAGGSVGRTNLSYCSGEDLKKSIEKLNRLPEDTVLLPGHG